MKLIVAVSALALCACSLTPSERAQATWHTLNLIDMGQTDHLARAPDCYSEGNPITKALIGEHPQRAEAAAVGIAYAAGYHFVSRWLDEKVEERPRMRYLRTAWHVLSIGTKAAIVARNHDHGLRVGSASCETAIRVERSGPPIM